MGSKPVKIRITIAPVSCVVDIPDEDVEGMDPEDWDFADQLWEYEVGNLVDWNFEILDGPEAKEAGDGI